MNQRDLSRTFRSRQPFGFRNRAATALLILATVGGGCHTAPPPPPVPGTLLEAQRLALQATRLQDASQWAAASVGWQRAARQFQLINDRTNLAVALHHQGICQQALGKPEEAAARLEQASRLNDELGLATPWWRNQIALVQLEASTAPDQAQARLDRLNHRHPGPDDAMSQGLLAHETARAKLRHHQPAPALADLALATTRFQEAGATFGQAAVEVTRAQTLEALGRLSEAESAWRSALAVFEAGGQLRGIATAMAGLGNCLAMQGRQAAEAESLLRRSAENFEALGLAPEARQARSALDQLAPKRER
ncbi:MAG: tetratricopeptide repeat protein [Verrucomicrobiales bacterium]|nr:tetratricopeptide repeat protein [Verrucomicrobiales bacterium]